MHMVASIYLALINLGFKYSYISVAYCYILMCYLCSLRQYSENNKSCKWYISSIVDNYRYNTLCYCKTIFDGKICISYSSLYIVFIHRVVDIN